jgi:hypothetical protein
MDNVISIRLETVPDRRVKGGKKNFYRVLVTNTTITKDAFGSIVKNTVSIMGMKIEDTDKTDFTNPHTELDTQAYQDDIEGEYFTHLRQSLADWYKGGKPHTFKHLW